MARPSRTEIKKGTEVQKQRNVDGRTGMEGQEQRDRNRGTVTNGHGERQGQEERD